MTTTLESRPTEQENASPLDPPISTDKKSFVNEAQTHSMFQRDPRWHQYQMLPDTFVQRRRAHRVLYLWSVVLFWLIAILCVLTSFLWVRGRQIRIDRDLLIASSEPVDAMRREVSRLQIENRLRIERAQAVETAKPDDGLLQTLLAIAHATDASKHGLSVTSLSIEMRAESHNKTENNPRTVVNARVENKDSAELWEQRISALDRLENVRRSMENDSASKSVRLTGFTICEKIVP